MLQARCPAEVFQFPGEHDAHAATQDALDIVRVEKRSLDAAVHVQGKNHGLRGVSRAHLLNDAGDGDLVTLLCTTEAHFLVVANVIAWIMAQQLTARGVAEGLLQCRGILLRQHICQCAVILPAQHGLFHPNFSAHTRNVHDNGIHTQSLR